MSSTSSLCSSNSTSGGGSGHQHGRVASYLDGGTTTTAATTTTTTTTAVGGGRSSVTSSTLPSSSLVSSLRRDVDSFAEQARQLRAALDHKTAVTDGESWCVHVHGALAQVSAAVRDLLVRYPHFKTNAVLVPAAQLVHSVKELDCIESNVTSADPHQRGTGAAHAALDRLETAVLNVTIQSFISGGGMASSATVSHHQDPLMMMRGSLGCLSPSSDTPLTHRPTQLGRQNNSHFYQPPGQLWSDSTGQFYSAPTTPRRALSAARRNSSLYPASSCGTPAPPIIYPADDWENGGVGGGGGGGNGDLEGEECDRLLAERDNGLDIALSRNKQWNRYCKDVLSYVRSRLNIEDEYAKKLQQLAAQWRPALKTTPFLPLSDVLEAGLTADQEHADATRATVEHLHERCVKVLEQRRAEHDATQRDIQKTHQKLLKALEDTQSELKRAQSSLQGREDGWKKARSSIQRHDDALSLSLAGFNSSHASSSFGAGSSSSSSASLLSEATRRRKEAERRRRQEEDAHTKCEEASRLVATLEHDLAAHRRALHLNKTKSISSLRELVYRCDQTTKACTQHYFKALGATGTQRPSAWTTLASTCRSYKPGAAYMSYVRQLPPTTATAAAASNNATTATSSTTSSSSDAARLVGGAGLPPALSTSSVASTSSAVFSMAAGSSASAATNSRRTTTTTTTTDALLGGGGGSYASSTAALHSDSAGFQNGRHPALASASAASTSLASQRRNAVQAEEHLLPAGLGPSLKLHRRAQKKNSGPSRLSSLGGGGDDERKWVNVDKSEAARTHRAVRIRQPVKCNDCETLSLLNTYQCRDCTLVWHRNCLIRTSQRCPCPSSSGSSTTTDPSSSSSTSVAAAKSWPSGATLSAASAAAASARRTSIFGVSLAGHLAEQKRVVPLILETTVEQLHRHGMRIKGIYRLCGVKSKIEAICEEFERHRNAQGSTALQNSIHLDAVSPVNLASVVKLYLRKLPDPLLTHELYDEWLRVAERLPLVRASTSTADEMSDEMKVATTLRPIIGRLPRVNHETLKLVALHLNRVTWYKHDNLMDSANLAAVVTPSLIWPPSSRSKTALVHAHSLAAVVERIIRHAHILFNVDKSEDRARFEEQFPETASPSVSESVDVLLLLPSGAAPPTNGDPALSDELCRTTLVVGDEDDDDIDGLDDEEEDEDEEFSLPDIVKPIGATTATDDTAGDDAATLRRVQPTQPQQQQQLLCATAAATEDDSSGTSGLGSSERTSHQQPPSQQQQHHHHPHSQRASSVASWTSSALRHSTAFDQSHDSADGSSNNNNGQEVAATVADRRYTTSIPITDDVSLCSIDSTGLLVDESSAPAIARSSVSSRLPLRRRCSAQKSSASRSDTQDSSTTAADTATSSPAPSQQHPDQDDVSYV